MQNRILILKDDPAEAAALATRCCRMMRAAGSAPSCMQRIATVSESKRAEVVPSGRWRMPTRVFVSVQTAADDYDNLVSLTETAILPGAADISTRIDTDHWLFPQTSQENIRAIDPSYSRHQPITH
jgi:hypothetical protein